MAVPLPATAVTLLLAAPGWSPAELWEAWPARRFVTTPAPCLRHGDLEERLRALHARHPEETLLEEVGRSVEGRPIHLLTLGRGPRRILLWSQMHGDEPSATPALLDVADFLAGRGAIGAADVLERTTLLMVPMLNPDGAERYTRRNAQAIDINRDALSLATPEGLLLKSLRDRHRPELAFNLHDQDRRTTVGDTGTLATISLLVVAGDPQGTLTPGRARAQRVASTIVGALAAFLPGGIARYDEDWNPRAFGDNVTAWGTPVVLVESGGLLPDRAFSDLTRLNFVALLSVLHALAADDLQAADPTVYEALPRNGEGGYVDVLIAGGKVWQAPGPGPYRADVGFDVLDTDPARAGCAGSAAKAPSRVREIGDGRLLGSGRRIDATGRRVIPALVASLRGFSARRWLTAPALDALARLGVARLAWPVPPSKQGKAQELALSLAAPGRPRIDVSDEATGPCPLELDAPPAPAAGTTLAAALAALTHGRWERGAAPRDLAPRLSDLACLPASGVGAPLLTPGAPASALLLRPHVPETVDPHELELEAVFVDGRQSAGAR